MSSTGLLKKLLKASKKKDGEVINAWVKSIVHHVYWCAAKSFYDRDDGSKTVKRFRSVLHHITNNHAGDEESDACSHGQLTEERAWINPGIPSCISKDLLLFCIFV